MKIVYQWFLVLCVLASLFGICAAAFPQIPAPQINLTGNIGCQGFPCLNSGTLSLSTDANHTMTAQETSAFSFKVTSTVSLTATRNLIFPSGRFPLGCVENATTGGQSIQVIGTSGTGVTITNGSSVCGMWNDGTNYVAGAGLSPTGVTPGSYTNTSLTVGSDGRLTAASSGSSTAALKTPQALWGFGDSYIFGVGATTPAVTGIVGLVSRDTTAVAATNLGVSGTLSGQISRSVVQAFQPIPLAQSVSLLDGGANDGTADNCGGAASSACITQFKNSMMAAEAWLTIPAQFRIIASQATQTGSWANDNLFISPPNPPNPTGLLSVGNSVGTSTSGSTLTFSIPSSASGFVGITYSYGFSLYTAGTFTVSVDGTLQTDNCSGTTTFTGFECSTVSSDSTGFSRQMFAVTSGTTHTVVITALTSNAIGIVGVDWIPPANTANENVVFTVGVNAIFTNAVVYNNASKAVVAAMAAAGLPDYFVDQIGGTPGVNDTTDISTTATTTTPASTANMHPNDGGYANLELTLQNSEIAAGYVFTALDAGGKSTTITGQVNVPLKAQGVGGTMAAGVSSLCSLSGGFGCGATDFNDGAGDQFGIAMQQLPSSSAPFSGAFAQIAFATSGWICDALKFGGSTSASGDFTPLRCTNTANGNTYQLGSMTSQGVAIGASAVATSLIGGGTAIPTVTGGVPASGSLAKWSSSSLTSGPTPTGSGTTYVSSNTTPPTTGHLVSWSTSGGGLDAVDSGVPVTSVPFLNLSNTWSNANQFNGATSFLNAVSVLPATAATSSANVVSPNLNINSNYWNGTASAADDCALASSPAAGTNPLVTITLNCSGSSGGHAVSLPFPVTVSGLTVSTKVTNAAGLQFPSTTGCAITIGAIGNSCTQAITLPVTEPDTAYKVAGCTVTGVTAGPITAADITATSTTSITVRMVALSATASNTAGAGTITCTVIHN